jgi:hypothetical protein
MLLREINFSYIFMNSIVRSFGNDMFHVRANNRQREANNEVTSLRRRHLKQRQEDGNGTTE